jgi:hypothetical protein
MAAYSDSARHRRWVVILDLNGDGMCAPEVLPHALGRTDSNRLLFVAFTVRRKLIRVISAREMTQRTESL